MKTISQKAKEYTLKRWKDLTVQESFVFCGQEVGKAYVNGMKEAFRMIEQEIDFYAVNGYQFPILHVRDFIDKMLGHKEAGKTYTVQQYDYDECKWINRMTLSSKEKAEDWMEREQRNLGGTWRVLV